MPPHCVYDSSRKQINNIPGKIGRLPSISLLVEEVCLTPANENGLSLWKHLWILAPWPLLPLCQQLSLFSQNEYCLQGICRELHSWAILAQRVLCKLVEGAFPGKCIRKVATLSLVKEKHKLQWALKWQDARAKWKELYPLDSHVVSREGGPVPLIVFTGVLIGHVYASPSSTLLALPGDSQMKYFWQHFADHINLGVCCQHYCFSKWSTNSGISNLLMSLGREYEHCLQWHRTCFWIRSFLVDYIGTGGT